MPLAPLLNHHARTDKPHVRPNVIGGRIRVWPFRIAAVLLWSCAFDTAIGSARAPLGIFAAAIAPAALATLSLAGNAVASSGPATGADPQLAGLGPREIDAGDIWNELGAAPVAAVQDAISALSADQQSPSAAQAQATALRATARSIPGREYSLVFLSRSRSEVS